MLQTGDPMPDAVVQAAPGEEVRLRELLADGPILLLFYLFDWSSTWTNEMELLRDRRAEFEAVGVRPFGISRDSAWTHISWAQALDLDFGLLSDFNGDATEAFGVGHEFRGLRGVSDRTAFLIDGEGTVRGAWHYGTSEVPDFDVLLAAASALP